MKYNFDNVAGDLAIVRKANEFVLKLTLADAEGVGLELEVAVPATTFGTVLNDQRPDEVVFTGTVEVYDEEGAG